MNHRHSRCRKVALAVAVGITFGVLGCTEDASPDMTTTAAGSAMMGGMTDDAGGATMATGGLAESPTPTGGAVLEPGMAGTSAVGGAQPQPTPGGNEPTPTAGTPASTTTR